MPLTRNPVRILIGIFAAVMGLSAFFRCLHPAALQYYNSGQHMVIYNWAAENCNNKLNISELTATDIENFETGCYHFHGHMRIEGNFSMPPLPDTTQCPTFAGSQFIQQYGTYLAKQCNFNGQHPECATYNPACTPDVNTGLGYEIRYGWVPNPDSVAEYYHGNTEDYEFEHWLAQSEDWKEAAARGRLSTWTINTEHCSKLGAGETSMCEKDFQAPDTWFMNHTDIDGWTDEVLGALGYELGGYWKFNEPENLPIYDIGKGPGTPAIHFNVFKANTDAISGLVAETKAKIDAKYPHAAPFEHFNSLMVPHEANPDMIGYNNYRDLHLVMKQRQLVYYVIQIQDAMARLRQVIKKYKEMTALSEGRFFTAHEHGMGEIIYAPNALGDSFYSDPDLEEARLNGTTDTNVVFDYLNDVFTFYPFAFSEDIWNKMRANGGQFTDAEFKALPEYGDIDYFPLVANITKWQGGDNCWHEEGDMYEQKYDKNTRKFTPLCKMEEPTDFPLEFIGMVHKKTNEKTGQPMLVFNQVSFSNNTFGGKVNDMSLIESAAAKNQLPDDVKRFNQRGAELYPDIWLLMWIVDLQIRQMIYFGADWFHNGLSKSKWARKTFYYLTWLFPNDPTFALFGEVDEELPVYEEVKIKAEYAIETFRTAWYVLYAFAVGFWAIVSISMLFQSVKKRSSQQS